MSGPKHLWSGAWQQESATAFEELAQSRVKPPDRAPAPAPSPRPRPRTRRRRFPALRRPGIPHLRRRAAIAFAGVLCLAGAAYGLTAVLGSSGAPAAAAGGSSAPAAATAPPRPSRPVRWLGMQIETVMPGAAVVDTVRPGSAGDLAGLQPGDVILEVNHHPVNGTGDIGSAISGLRAGDVVALQVSHGSALYQTEATLAAPPSVSP